MSIFGDTDVSITGPDSGDILKSIISSKALEFASTAFAIPTRIPIVVTSISSTAVAVSTPLVTLSPATVPATTPVPSPVVVSSTTAILSTSTPVSIIASSTTPIPKSSAPVISSFPSVTVPAAQSASPSPSETPSTKSGASPAAIGVTVTILLLAICAAAFFLIRKKYIQRRKDRRLTWNAPAVPPKVDHTITPYGNFGDLENGSHHRGMDHFDNIDINEKYGPTPLPDRVTYQTFYAPTLTAPAPLAATGFAPPRMASPPPVMVPTAEDQPSPIGVGSPSIGSGPAQLVTSTAFSATRAPQTGSGNIVVVARTFIPNLPDELSIQTGEHVRVLSRFDDGWCHVERLRSGFGAESGVVPAECLEAFHSPVPMPPIPDMGFSQEAVEQWRLSKRKSSLAPAGPARY